MPIPATDVSLPRRLLRDEAYDRISAAIVRGELTPGEKLNDQALASWLGISRTPVREALSRLERTGLVRTVPGRETVVSELDLKMADAAVRVAAVLHSLAVREATPLITPEDLEAMRAANDALEVALHERKVPAAIAADDAFHEVVLRRCGNPVLVSALEQVMPLLRRAEHLRFGAFLTPDSVPQHVEILQALQDADAEAAAEAAQRNWLTLER
ncbi:MAG: GntR family transcriptional regulator [Microbacteriaceae bacterium]|jgi:DNA-binding GntR family transcriptional regulator|nr:GntR family transcriptional regulator [Microbacteriaceae bacterium]MCI1207637.1 GntR family transcriptional regulator [Microbacteriaceae bacterium]